MERLHSYDTESDTGFLIVVPEADLIRLDMSGPTPSRASSAWVRLRRNISSVKIRELCAEIGSTQAETVLAPADTRFDAIVPQRSALTFSERLQGCGSDGPQRGARSRPSVTQPLEGAIEDFFNFRVTARRRGAGSPPGE